MENKARNYHKIAAAICLAALLCVVMTAAVRAANAAPGSEEDPVVTKSYVDKQIAGAGGVFVPVEVAAGRQLIGGAGAEIILRSGEAAIISNESNGVSDLTGGADLMTGAPVQPNHLLLVPRDDGRGLAAHSDLWVMVRGSYTIQ
ncbi:MAG: hypothetical protein LBE16_09510 [Clostridiales Family XIII bacterium]|nr:hypothetical protein [Clostridiales Family XIII bacterium]